jgi:hypothetical protein
VTLLLSLPYSLHVRNFLASGLLDMLLARGHRLPIVVPENFVEPVTQGLAHASGAVEVRSQRTYQPGRVRRLIRDILVTGSYLQRSDVSTYRHKLTTRRTSARRRVEIGFWRLLSRRVSPETVGRFVERRIPIKRRATRLVRETAPDVVVSATFILDPLDIEITKAARRAGVPVVGFPASWDTLSSKGFFLDPPDVLMVWGEDTHRHAVEYHGYRPDRVTITGPPHFDVYGPAWPTEPRERFLAARGIDPDKRVILFAGTTVTYWADEPQQLRALSDLITRGELGDAVVWYRPHPRRSHRDVTALTGLPGVYVDDQSLRHKTSGGSESSGLGSAYSARREDLAHYRGLLEAVDGVVTAFSSMTIEAALMGKPSLVVAFGLGDDTLDRLLQHAEYVHMRDVLSTPGVVMCRSLPEVVAGIRQILRGDFAAYSEVLRKRAGEIAHAEDGRARERIVEAIEKAGARR